MGRSQVALLLDEPGEDYVVQAPFSELSTIKPDLLWLIQNEKEESSQRKEQNSLKMELDRRNLEHGMKLRVPHMKQRGLHKMNHYLRTQDQIQNSLALKISFLSD